MNTLVLIGIGIVGFLLGFAVAWFEIPIRPMLGKRAPGLNPEPTYRRCFECGGRGMVFDSRLSYVYCSRCKGEGRVSESTTTP